jgi:hypothetical protein
MYEKARELGLELGAWFAPHLSPRAPIFQEHPEYRMVSVTGLPAGGGYGFQTITVADWNTGIHDWVLADLKRWKEEGGLDYLFIDSLSNMGLVQANYAAGMRTNWNALGRLIGDIQALGIRSLTCECISPWAASRFGVADLRGDLLEQNRAVAGQNDFAWWRDELDMAHNICLCLQARNRTEEEMQQFLFRAMASRGYIMFEHHYGIEHQLAAWWARLNHVYNQALPHMRSRRVLPDGQGILWTDGTSQVVWAYRDFEFNLAPGAPAEHLAGDSVQTVSHNGSIALRAGSVYRFRGGHACG